MTFDPKPYFIEMGKDKKGNPKLYLQVAHRIMWFRDEHPDWTLKTYIVQLDPFPVMCCEVIDANGRLIATGHAMAMASGNKIWSGREVEKAETAAQGRALAAAGFGTQFADEDEDDHLADSPVERSQKSQNGGKSNAKGAKVTNGHQQSETRQDAPFIENGTTERVTIKTVEIVDKDGQRRLKLYGDDDTTIWADSRQMFIERGWIEDTEWKNLGSHKLKNRIPIDRTYRHVTDEHGEIKGGYWELTAVDEVVF